MIYIDVVFMQIFIIFGFAGMCLAQEMYSAKIASLIIDEKVGWIYLDQVNFNRDERLWKILIEFEYFWMH